MMLQQKSSPEAIRRVEEQARMQAQQRPEEAEPPLVVKTPSSLNFHGDSPGSEAAASEGKEKILVKVQNRAGSVQPIRIYTVINCINPPYIITY